MAIYENVNAIHVSKMLVLDTHFVMTDRPLRRGGRGCRRGGRQPPTASTGGSQFSPARGLREHGLDPLNSLLLLQPGGRDLGSL